MFVTCVSAPEAFSQDTQVGGAPLLPEFEDDTGGLFPEDADTDPPADSAYIPFVEDAIGPKPDITDLLKENAAQSQDKPQTTGDLPLTVQTVEQSTLKTLESQILLGTLNESNGGVSPLAWRGSSQRAIATLLKHVTGRLQSQAVRYELETVLMSSVFLPNGFPETGPKSLSSYRQSLLKTMGAQTALIDLFQLENPLQGGDVAAIGAQISPLLSTGNMDAVCPVEQAVQSLTLPPKAAARWRAVKVLCHLSHGNFDTAEIAYDLLLSQGFQDQVTAFYIDYAFGYINDSEAKSHTVLNTLEKLSDLQSAAAILSKGPVPERIIPKVGDWTSGQSSLLAAAFASWDTTGDRRRVLAIEQALESGNLTVPQAQGLFAAKPKGDRDNTSGNTSNRRLHPSQNPEDRAALYRHIIAPHTTDDQPAQIEKIDLLLRGIQAAPSRRSAGIFVQHLDPVNDPLITNPKIMKRTKTDQQGLIAEGLFTSIVNLDHDRADAWLALADATGQSPHLKHLWPLVVVSKSLKTNREVKLVDSELDLWVKSAPRNQEAIRLLLNALQKQPKKGSPEDTKEDTKEETDLKGTEAAWPSANISRHAELVLQASLLFEETPPSAVKPATSAALIRAFVSIGRQKTAQLLAIEALSGLI